MPAGAVYVGRPSYYGNPFVIGVGTPFRLTAQGKLVVTKILRAVPDAETAVGFFRAWVNSHHADVVLFSARQYLRGHDLACWCPIGAPCHGDVLLELANQ